MSEIKQYFTELRGKMTGDTVTVADISGLIRKIELGYNDTAESLGAANNESKKRKEKIRDELNPKIESLEDKILGLEKKTDTSELQTELDSLKAFKTKAIKGQRQVFETRFQKIVEHPKFEKAKDRFSLPDVGEDKKYDLSKVKDEDMERNIFMMQDLDSLDYFGEVEGNDDNDDDKPPTDGNRFRDRKRDDKPEIKNKLDLMNYMSKELKNSV